MGVATQAGGKIDIVLIGFAQKRLEAGWSAILDELPVALFIVFQGVLNAQIVFPQTRAQHFQFPPDLVLNLIAKAAHICGE